MKAKTKLNVLMALALAAMLLGGTTTGPQVSVAAPEYVVQSSINVGTATPNLTAVDPLAWSMFGDVLPARPFLYSVDASGLTITRFNDNKVVGTWPWPTDEVWIELPDGSITSIPMPAGGWEPVGMTVSYPTELEIGNRVKEIPDLTPPWTFVYVVMAHSGYEWTNAPNAELLQTSNVRDTLRPMTSPDTESSLLLQIDVSDPSFSTSRDPAVPSDPHIAGAILGHNAGQPVYDRKTGNVYVGNEPSGSLATGLTSFVSVIHRIPPTVTAEEREIPGIGKPVIRCGPQHPEVGMPVGRPQAYACYDPSGLHPINDNEHVGAYGELEDRDGDGTLDEQYVWEFRNLPDWLHPHTDLVTGEYDGILYGTPPVTGEWYAEARVHNLDDEWGIFSDWHPIRLLVSPTAEYLPIKAQFAVGVPVSYQLEGTGVCTLEGAPAWVDIKEVPNGCVVMGRAPISGEHYSFTMPSFRETAYPDIPIVFSGDVVGAYNFDPLPEGVGISGMAWHQVEKYADPSTETAVLSGEFIGVDPATGQLYRVLQAPGQPQPPNERPAETAIVLDAVSVEGAPLAGLPASGFRQVAVEADRDIYVAANSAVIKVSGGTAINIDLTPTGINPSSLSLDSDLRTAIIGVEPGQVDHGALWVAGSDKAAVIDTHAGTVATPFDVAGASSVSVDFVTQYAYVATGMSSIAFFGPAPRPLMAPRIWSSEEVNWFRGYPGEFQLMATGDLPMTLDLMGELPDGLTFVDNGDGTATISGTPTDLAGGDGYAYTLTATNSEGVYAQALGITVYTQAEITSADSVTFFAGSASSFPLEATAATTPILYTWDELLMPPGVTLADNEDGTASLMGTPQATGVYQFTVGANSTYPIDATQWFTLNVVEGPSAPVITSRNTVTWEVLGAPFGPDQFTVSSIGAPTPELSVVTEPGQTGLPLGVTFIDNGDSTATFGADCQITWPGMEPSCLGILPDAAEGTWTFTIRATNDGGATYATQAFTLVIETATSIMTPGPDAPANLSFEYTQGGTLPAEQTFSPRTLGDTMPYAAVTTADWLHATPENGTIGPAQGDLNVSVDTAGLAPGTYTGSILVTSAGTDGPFATAFVTLTVNSDAEITLSSNTLSFGYTVVSHETPPAQSVSVTSGGLPLNYTAATSDAWLHATPASGTTPGELSISADPTGLGIGTYIGVVKVASDYAANDTQTIVVTLIKRANSQTEFSPLVKVSLDVGTGPEGLAINRNTHDLYLNTGNEAAEAAESSAEVPTVEEPPDPSAGSAVFRFTPGTGSDPGGVVGRTLVHSEGEYIAVNSETGIVYHASQGTGEIAVVNGLTNEVVTYIPLWADDGLYMRDLMGPYQPYQIAVDEEQNIIYVGAKAPAVPDPPVPPEGQPFPCKAIHEMPDDEYDCWNPGSVFVIDGETNTVIDTFLAGDDPEGVVFAAHTGKVYVSNEDDGSITVASGATRDRDGNVVLGEVLSTIIRGEPVDGWWQPTCDENSLCGERGQAALWPERSACWMIDDEAEEADKMAVDPHGDVYIIDDKYRVAKINGSNDRVTDVLAIPGYDCETDDPYGTFRTSANNIAFSAAHVGVGRGNPSGIAWRLYVTSEQNTVSLIDPIGMTLDQTITVDGAVELDAITVDPARNSVFITDEDLSALWILQGECANGQGNACEQP